MNFRKQDRINVEDMNSSSHERTKNIPSFEERTQKELKKVNRILIRRVKGLSTDLVNDLVGMFQLNN